MSKQNENREIKLVRKYAAEGRDMERIICWWKNQTCGSVTRTENEVTFYCPTLAAGWLSVTLPVW